MRTTSHLPQSPRATELHHLKRGACPQKLLFYWHTRARVSAFKFLGFLLRVQGTETTERCQTCALVHPLLMYTRSRITTWVYWLHWIIGQLWRLFRPSPKIYLFVCLRKIYKTHSTVYESLTLHRPTSASLVRLIVVFYQIRFWFPTRGVTENPRRSSSN